MIRLLILAISLTLCSACGAESVEDTCAEWTRVAEECSDSDDFDADIAHDQCVRSIEEADNQGYFVCASSLATCEEWDMQSHCDVCGHEIHGQSCD